MSNIFLAQQAATDKAATAAQSIDPSTMDPEALEMWMLNQMADHNEKFGEPILAERIANQWGIRYDDASGDYIPDPEAAATSRMNRNGTVNYQSSGQAEQPVAAAFDSQRTPMPQNYHSAAGPIAANEDQAAQESRAGLDNATGQFENAHIEARNLAALATGQQQQQLRNIGAESAYQSDRANRNAAASFARGTANRAMLGSLVGAGYALHDRYGKSASQAQPADYSLPQRTAINRTGPY